MLKRSVYFIFLTLFWHSQLSANNTATIFDAIYENDKVTVLKLLKTGTDPNARDADEQTPLEVAVYKAVKDTTYSELVKILLKNGARPNENRKGITALSVGVANAKDISDALSVLEVLLKNGANPNLAATPNPKTPGITPLMDAARSGKIQIAKLLIRYGADPKLKGPGGKSSMEMAKDKGHLELAQFLAQVK